MAELNRKCLSFLAGLIAAFLLMEAGLRMFAVFTGPRESDPILLVGNTPPAAYLAAALQARFPGHAPRVVSAGSRNQNSAELRDRMPVLIEQFRPRAIVVRTGDTNIWNRHLVYRFLDHPPGPFSFLGRWKTFRLLSSLYVPETYRWSHFFPDTKVEEFPTIAMRWAGYLNANPDPAGLSQPEISEALGSLERWLADPRSGSSAVATRVLADLQTREKMPSEAQHTLQRYFERGGGFDQRLYDWLKGAGQPEALARIRKLAGPTGNTPFYGLRENPFYAGGEPPPYAFHRNFSEQQFRERMENALPPPAAGFGDKPGLRTLRESFLDQGTIFSWVYDDLAAIVRLARERHVPALLQTYPPERFTGKDHAADTVIRSAALALEVPLSDTSSELRQRWGRSERSGYYTKAPSEDQLNDAGNRLEAEILAKDLARLLSR